VVITYEPAVMTILITNDFQRRGVKTGSDEGSGTGGDEVSVVLAVELEHQLIEEEAAAV
jgi:hypothetical protein